MRSAPHMIEVDIERLIRQKPFESLSLEERAMVLTEVDRQEYERIRETALLAARCLSEPVLPLRPRPGTHAYLRKRLQQRRQGWMQRVGQVLDYRLPVWQAAAATVVLVLAVQLAGRPPFSSAVPAVSSHQITDSTLHDSAFQRVRNSHEDSAFLRLQRETDTL